MIPLPILLPIILNAGKSEPALVSKPTSPEGSFVMTTEDDEELAEKYGLDESDFLPECIERSNKL